MKKEKITVEVQYLIIFSLIPTPILIGSGSAGLLLVALLNQNIL